ncbi:MAG: hypothetical protein LUD81_06910, partial [Clostridiales bacterium]|nr:hypothetical protein [Clostridiales bacterium]
YVTGDWYKIHKVTIGYPSYFLNKYVIYTDDNNVVKDGNDEILYLESCEINVLYPIKREGLGAFLPKGWICRFEMWDIFR